MDDTSAISSPADLTDILRCLSPPGVVETASVNGAAHIGDGAAGDL